MLSKSEVLSGVRNLEIPKLFNPYRIGEIAVERDKHDRKHTEKYCQGVGEFSPVPVSHVPVSDQEQSKSGSCEKPVGLSEETGEAQQCPDANKPCGINTEQSNPRGAHDREDAEPMMRAVESAAIDQNEEKERRQQRQTACHDLASNPKACPAQGNA